MEKINGKRESDISNNLEIQPGELHFPPRPGNNPLWLMAPLSGLTARSSGLATLPSESFFLFQGM